MAWVKLCEKEEAWNADLMRYNHPQVQMQVSMTT